MRFDYFYGSQAEQFSFIRIPRILIKDPRFSPLSVYAKMLYAVLLDRMSLSSKNGWFDEDNRVYIIYPTAEAQEDLGIGKKKALEVMSELVEFGLLEKKRRGLGLPNLLYLKSFMSGGTEADTSVSKTIINRKCQSETSGGVQTDSSESFPQEPAEVSGPVLPEVPDPGPGGRARGVRIFQVPRELSRFGGCDRGDPQDGHSSQGRQPGPHQPAQAQSIHERPFGILRGTDLTIGGQNIV